MNPPLTIVTCSEELEGEGDTDLALGGADRRTRFAYRKPCPVPVAGSEALDA